MSPHSLSKRILAALAIVGAAMSASNAGEIAGYNPASQTSHNTYDRFLGPYPGNPTLNTTSDFLLHNFMAPGLGGNLSGVGFSVFDPTYSIALVSPQHILGNFHVFQFGRFT